MAELDSIKKNLLAAVADIHEIPAGAYSLRVDGEAFAKNDSEHITIVPKKDKPGIDIYIAADTKKESLHIPVLLAKSGLKELVYNDFHIGENADVTIVAGCGIHNGGSADSEHSGIHAFYLGRGAKVKYIEKHYGEGDGNGRNLMNPTTVVELAEGAYMEMETAQIKGVDSTDRITRAKVAAGASLVVREKIMTHGTQYAKTYFEVDLDGKDAAAHVISRSVARDDSKQLFISHVNGNEQSTGRTECDAIIMDRATVSAIPEIVAAHPDASLVHEAAIGRIAGEQLTKLMTLGLTEKEAEEQIISGFLK